METCKLKTMRFEARYAPRAPYIACEAPANLRVLEPFRAMDGEIPAPRAGTGPAAQQQEEDDVS